MTWNYRVIHTRTNHVWGEDYTDRYEIHEVYYSADDNGNLIAHSWSEKPMSPYGTDLQELTSDLELMSRAFKLPVLEIKKVDGENVLVEVDI